MKDIRVTHDQVGSYADWYASDNNRPNREPWLVKYWDEYLTAKKKPHYPMPAIPECPWCGSKHLGHSHFISNGLIIPE